LATPGARLALKPSDNLTVLAAVFSGDPAGSNCIGNPQACNRYGTTFSFSGGSLWISELQYAINQGKQAVGLPGVYKLGAWYATAEFADQHFGLNGAGVIVSLADPAAAGPLNRHGDGGVYAVADQMIWRAGERSLNLFARGGLAPSDRNLVSYYLDGGAAIKGLLPSRPADTLTFGVAYAKISRDAAALDQDTLAFNGPPYPIRDYELTFELNYAIQLAGWWVVQPDLQYIVHPGGNVADPTNPATTVRNAFIVGVRSTIKF
jgi:porin